MPTEMPYECEDCGDTEDLYFDDNGFLKCPECHFQTMMDGPEEEEEY